MSGFSWTYDTQKDGGKPASDAEAQRAGARLDEESQRRVDESRNMLSKLWDNVRTLGKMIKDPGYSFPTQLKVLFVVAAIYVISPIDLVPDFLIPFGVLDDAGLIALVFSMMTGEIGKYKDKLWPRAERVDE